MKRLFLADLIGAISFYVLAKCLFALSLSSSMVMEVFSRLMSNDSFLDWYATHNKGLPFSEISEFFAFVLSLISIILAAVLSAFLWLLVRKKLSKS